MTKTIEDYPELDKWLDDNHNTAENVRGDVIVYLGDDVEQKLLEMQKTIEDWQKAHAERVNRIIELEKETDSLNDTIDAQQERIKELESYNLELAQESRQRGESIKEFISMDFIGDDIEDFLTCSTCNYVGGQYKFECILGLWSVQASNKAKAFQESLHYFEQYKSDGEYYDLIGDVTQQERIKELEKDNHRKEVFIRGHIEKLDGVRHINPSTQVLKRALARVGESMGVPERLINKESK